MATGSRDSRDGSDRPISRPLRGKLDPRLDALLDMGLARVRSIQQGERRALQSLSKELRAPAKERDPELRKRLAREAWERVHPRVFSPLTTGIRFVGEQDELPERVRAQKEPLLSVIVQAKSSADDLARHGFSVRSRSGDVFTAWISWSKLAKRGPIDEDPAILSIELPRALKLCLDKAMQATGLGMRHTTPPVQKGTGVIIGVVDRFLDFHHPDFARTSAGYVANAPDTRILRIWDQEPEGGILAGESTPSALGMASGLDYGVEYDKSEIEQTLLGGSGAFSPVRHGSLLPLDPGEVSQHGTMVCGAALGNGAQSTTLPGSGLLEGAAPEAELIFVHLKSETELERRDRGVALRPEEFASSALVSSDFLMDACSYVFARAEDLGLPCVLNLSLGDALGAHDGTSRLNLHLHSLLDLPDRAIVVSAGNDNGKPTHASGSIAIQGSSASFDLVVAAAAAQPIEVRIEYDAADRFDTAIDFTAPSLTPPPPVPLIPTAPPGLETLYAGGSGDTIHVLSALGSGSGGNSITVLMLPPPSGAVPAGTYTITLTATTLAASGAFEAWTAISNSGQRFGSSVAPQPNVHSPAYGSQTLNALATGERLITVAAHDGAAVILDESGRGPAHGVAWTKPDLCAPTNVMAPAPGSRSTGNAPLSGYAMLGGTSAAAPLVAGAAAVLLPSLAPMPFWSDIRTALLRFANPAVWVMQNGASVAATQSEMGAGRLDFAYAGAPIAARLRGGVPAPGRIQPAYVLYPPAPLSVQSKIRHLQLGHSVTGLVIRAEAPSEVELLELELPLAALSVRSAELRGLPPGRQFELDGREASEWLDVAGAIGATIKGGRVRIRAGIGAWLRIPRLNRARAKKLAADVRIKRTSSALQHPQVRVHELAAGRVVRVFQSSP